MRKFPIISVKFVQNSNFLEIFQRFYKISSIFSQHFFEITLKLLNHFSESLPKQLLNFSKIILQTSRNIQYYRKISPEFFQNLNIISQNFRNILM